MAGEKFKRKKHPHVGSLAGAAGKLAHERVRGYADEDSLARAEEHGNALTGYLMSTDLGHKAVPRQLAHRVLTRAMDKAAKRLDALEQTTNEAGESARQEQFYTSHEDVLEEEIAS